MTQTVCVSSAERRDGDHDTRSKAGSQKQQVGVGGIQQKDKGSKDRLLRITAHESTEMTPRMLCGRSMGLPGDQLY